MILVQIFLVGVGVPRGGDATPVERLLLLPLPGSPGSRRLALGNDSLQE